jgi:hypothetical protein
VHTPPLQPDGEVLPALLGDLALTGVALAQPYREDLMALLGNLGSPHQLGIAHARAAVDAVVKGDMVCDFGETPRVGLADGLAECLEGVTAVRVGETELVVAVENAGGLGVDLLVQSQQVQSRPHGTLPGSVVAVAPWAPVIIMVAEYATAGNCMRTGTDSCLGLDGIEDECQLVDPCADFAGEVKERNRLPLLVVALCGSALCL